MQKARLRAWQRLSPFRRCPPQALLLAGDRKTSAVFSQRLVQAWLCEKGGEDAPCLACHPCLQAASKTHPDVVTLVSPCLDEVRSLLPRLACAPYSDRRVVLLENAEEMSAGAANALLKPIEEPLPHTHFLFLSSCPKSLPATLKSRLLCFRLPWQENEAEEKKEEKERLRNALANPSGNALAFAEDLAAKDFPLLLSWWQDVVYDFLLGAIEEKNLQKARDGACFSFMLSRLRAGDRPLNARVQMFYLLGQWEEVLRHERHA